jgi:hypothetical protein
MSWITIVYVPMVLKRNNSKSFYHLRCNGDNCEGIERGGRCIETVDCVTSLYCNMGICSDPISMGSDCTFDNQCGRGGACFFKSSSSLTGKCTALFSVPNNYFLNFTQSSSNGISIGILVIYGLKK